MRGKPRRPDANGRPDKSGPACVLTLNPLTIALTGGRGRIAPGLANHLEQKGYLVQTFSRRGGDGLRDIADLCKPEALSSFDTILHLGWSSVPLLAEQQPGIEDRNDLPLARALLEATRSCLSAPKIVFFSTAAVYGNTDTLPVDEDHICRPLGRYATSKLEAEKIFLNAPRSAVLRITNIFGAGCALTRSQGIIPLLVEAARSGKTISIWGDGGAAKDYVSVEDLYRAVDLILRSDLRGVFNIASGHVLTVNQLVSLVSESSGLPIRKEHVPAFPWDVQQAYVSSCRLQSLTGWQASVDPQSAIAAMLRS